MFIRMLYNIHIYTNTSCTNLYMYIHYKHMHTYKCMYDLNAFMLSNSMYVCTRTYVLYLYCTYIFRIEQTLLWNWQQHGQGRGDKGYQKLCIYILQD